MKWYSYVGLFIMSWVILCFAGDYGTLGDKLFPVLAKAFGVDIAGKIMAALVAVIGWIIGRVVLKKIPTRMQGIVGKIFWKFAAVLFGSGVVMDNHTDPEYVKAELVKKYPLLQIDIKKIAEGKQ